MQAIPTVMQLPKPVRLNSGLHAIDKTIQSASDDPSEQLGMLFMAHALAMGRLLTRYNITDRGRRLKIIKASGVEFDSKLRQFAHFTPQSKPDPEMSPVFFAVKQGDK